MIKTYVNFTVYIYWLLYLILSSVILTIVNKSMDLGNDVHFANARSGYEDDKQQDYNHGMNCFMRKVLFANSLKTLITVNRNANQNVNINQDIKHQNQYSLECDDCPNIIEGDDVCIQTKQLVKQNSDHQSQQIDHITIRNALVKHHRREIILIMLYFFFQIVLRFVFNVLLIQLFNNISLMRMRQAFLIANICGCLLMICEVFRQNALHQSTHLMAIVKNQLLFLMFCKITKLSSHSGKQKEMGNIINVFESDFKTIEIKAFIFFAAVSTLIPTALYIYLLYQLIGYFTFIALLILIFFIILQIIFAKISINIRAKLLTEQDERLKISSEVIENIKHIKFYGWELAFEDIILKLRANQLESLLKFNIIRSIDRVTLETSIYVVIFVVLYFVDKSQFGQNFTTEKMVVSICIFYVLRFIIAQFGVGLAFILQFRLVLQRICKILNFKTVAGMVSIQKNTKIEQSQISQKQLPSGLVNFSDFNGYWKEDGSGKPALLNINLSVQPGAFVGVTGKVGSGKSTLLAAILEEIPFCSGRLSKKGSIAYVEQEPFIMSTTIQENVLFGHKLDRVKYEEALRRTCLEADLQLFEEGDQTVVGERGITLSGGQKARISLARALYSDSDIYLFDDPLSAVDSNVARTIYENVVLHMRRKKTVLLVTHQVQYLSECDTVLIMKEGQIIHKDKPGNLVHVFESLANEQKSVESILSQQKLQKGKQKIAGEAVIAKKRTVRQPEMSLLQYCLYSKINYFIVPFTLVAYALSEILLGLILRILAQYSITKKGENSRFSSLNELWLYLAIIFLILVLMNIIKYFGTYLCVTITNKKLYQDAVDRLLRAPCSYYDVTSLGDVAIRLSDNLNEIETEFTLFFITTIQGPLNFLMILTNVALASHWFIIPAVVSLVIIIVGFCYLESCLSQAKKLAINTKATILAKVLETFHGLTQIKIYNKRLSLINQFAKLLNNSLKASRCFADVFRVFVAYSGYIFCIVIWAAYLIGIFDIKYEQTWLYFYSVALLFNFTDSFRWYSLHLVTMLGFRVNIHKVAYLANLTSEKALKTNYDQINGLGSTLSSDHSRHEKSQLWFRESMSIKVQNLSMRYQPDLPLVLHGISFQIGSKQKVGIVGRTGSGKSSIVQALLRLYEPEAGSVYEIGGFNALEMGLHTLRQNISVIPQTPFLFKGTVRKNLDPFDSCSNEEIWTALEQSSLKETIEKLPQKLDTVFMNSAQVLSVGEKQLLCLARALLRRSGVLILDEATSNVDMVSDQFIQRCIKKHFSDSIVITIAHRLHTVADYDRIFVIEKGRIVEMGAPHELIMRQGMFAKMVESSGTMAEQIRRISREAYHN